MDLMRRNEIWDPFRELTALSNRMNRLFGLTRGSGNGSQEELATADWSPACDISETEKEFRITAELPNVPRDGVHVTLENGVLTIQGERKEEKEEKGARFHRRELSYGSFVRRFTMPETADESSIDARFKDGMLKISIAKTKPAKKTEAKQIAIH
jgi:HSP20 family protein